MYHGRYTYISCYTSGNEFNERPVFPLLFCLCMSFSPVFSLYFSVLRIPNFLSRIAPLPPYPYSNQELLHTPDRSVSTPPLVPYEVLQECPKLWPTGTRNLDLTPQPIFHHSWRGNLSFLSQNDELENGHRRLQRNKIPADEVRG